MNEKTGGSLSIDTYLSKQEGLLLEHIRRMLQAETKITLLEAALQDMYKRNEELTQQIETTNVALEQAINGLAAATNDKNNLTENVKSLEQSLSSTRSDLNQALSYRGEVDKLNVKIEMLTTDYTTLKQNYDITLREHNKLLAAQETTVKKRKVKSTESEWTDGQY